MTSGSQLSNHLDYENLQPPKLRHRTALCVMSNDEAEEIFEELTTWLRGNGFDWLVRDVERVISRGEKVEKEVKRWKLDEEEGKYVRSSHSSSFSARKEYSATEQLELLIDAIEKTIVHGAEIDHAIVSYFQNEKQSHKEDRREPIEVVLASPLDESGDEDLSLKLEREEERLRESRQLQELLNQLRERI